MAENDGFEFQRVLGPYKEQRGRNTRYAIHLIDADGERRIVRFVDEAQANEKAKAWREVAEGSPIKTVESALGDYEYFRRVVKGNKPGSVKETSRRLTDFFHEPHIPLYSVTDRKAQRYYDRLVSRVNPRTGEPLRPDSHRNYLAEARSFLRWCVKKGWIRDNPLEQVEGTGRRSSGKEKLRVDEAKKWLEEACRRAYEGDPGAVAAMMSLLMAMRASEIVKRVVRDVDDGGQLLWIPEAKTKKGVRNLRIPRILQPLLLALAAGRPGTEWLFIGTKRPGSRYKTGRHDRDWVRKHVVAICKAAGVSEVTTHSMRGLHTDLAIEAGATPDIVAGSLGHESFRTTQQSYLSPETTERLQSQRTEKLLTDGKNQVQDPFPSKGDLHPKPPKPP
jgi:integrase